MPTSPSERQIGSVSGIFNREILEWTVHEDETVKRPGREEGRLFTAPA
jgi:hypothetical protein